MRHKVKYILGIVVIVTGLFYYQKRYPFREIYKENLSAVQQQYLDFHYLDKNVSKGEVFDIRVLSLNSDKLIGVLWIEVINTYNLDLYVNNLNVEIIADNGQRCNMSVLILEGLNCKLFKNSNISYIAVLDYWGYFDSYDDFMNWIDENNVDLANLTVEIESYRLGKKEIHHLKFDKEERRRIFQEFFDSYYAGVFNLNEETENIFNSYYWTYLSVLETREEREMFLETLWKHVDTTDDNRGYFNFSSILLYDYINCLEVNESNVKEAKERLQTVLYKYKDYIDRCEEEQFYQIKNRVAWLLTHYASYDEGISKEEEIQQDFINVVEKADFWLLVQKYLK